MTSNPVYISFFLVLLVATAASLLTVEKEEYGRHRDAACTADEHNQQAVADAYDEDNEEGPDDHKDTDDKKDSVEKKVTDPEGSCDMVNPYKMTYAVDLTGGETNHSYHKWFTDLLGMHVMKNMPETLRKLKIVWYAWKKCEQGKRTIQMPEIHIAPIQERAAKQMMTNWNIKAAGQLTHVFKHDDFSAIADTHLAMWVTRDYFDKVLRGLVDAEEEDEDKWPYFGPVDRADADSTHGPYQLYMQIPGYPYVLEYDTDAYNHSIKEPVFRGVKSLDNAYKAVKDKKAHKKHGNKKENRL